MALLEGLAREVDPPTSIREPASAVDRHLADSLSGLEVESLARAQALADIGAGAGFPGLPLAAARPRARVDLIEATGRKCEVIARLAAEAGLVNARPVVARAEEWAAGEGAGAYDVVTARAVGSLALLVEYAAPLLTHGGVLVAWKGVRSEEEERSGAAAAALVGMRPVSVRAVTPFQGAATRHLHVVAKTGATPERFPRRPGAARKRPLA
jgi:16S rRNA (guanine527-N7)-methyltransferase